MTETKGIALKEDLVGRALRRVPVQYRLALKTFRAHLRETGKELTLETVQGYLDQKKKTGVCRTGRGTSPVHRRRLQPSRQRPQSPGAGDLRQES
ncbi:hypothetical protein ES705_40384 [subsurface metagenome]